MNAPTTCTDYDACSDATVDCGSGASCVDATAPATGYQCECDPGYEGASVSNAAATCTENTCPVSATFVTNKWAGNNYQGWKTYNQTPKELNSNLFVFGSKDGQWFKMQGVDAEGNDAGDRYTNAISSLSQLTQSIWNSAKTPGVSYSVENLVMGPCP
jgi:hypothetical protein